MRFLTARGAFIIVRRERKTETYVYMPRYMQPFSGIKSFLINGLTKPVESNGNRSTIDIHGYKCMSAMEINMFV